MNLITDKFQAKTNLLHLSAFMGLALALRLAVNLGLHIWSHAVSQAPLFTLANKLRVIDSVFYHQRALSLLQSWSNVSFFKMFVQSSQRDHFATPLAALYDLFGVRPWAVSIVLCLCYLAVGFLAYALARGLNQPERRARWLALLISLWPPTLAWSVLPLRDGPFTMAVFLFLSSLIWLLAPGPAKPARTIFCWLGLILGSGLAYVLKGYMLWVLPPVALLGFAIAFLRNLGAEQKTGWPRLCSAPLLVLTTLVVLYSAMYPAAPVTQAMPAAQNQIQVTALPTPKTSQPPAPPTEAGTWASLKQKLDAAWDKVTNPKEFLERARYLSLLEKEPSYKGTGISPQGAAGRYGVSQQSWGTIIKQAAIGFWDLLTFPPPWQRWPARENWGLFTILVSMLSVAWYLLLPGVCMGLFFRVRHGDAGGMVLLAWVLIGGLGMGWAMLNLGTLFRLREMIVLPMLTAFYPGVYLWLGGILGLTKLTRKRKPLSRI